MDTDSSHVSDQQQQKQFTLSSSPSSPSSTTPNHSNTSIINNPTPLSPSLSKHIASNSLHHQPNHLDANSWTSKSNLVTAHRLISNSDLVPTTRLKLRELFYTFLLQQPSIDSIRALVNNGSSIPSTTSDTFTSPYPRQHHHQEPPVSDLFDHEAQEHLASLIRSSSLFASPRARSLSPSFFGSHSDENSLIDGSLALEPSISSPRRPNSPSVSREKHAGSPLLATRPPKVRKSSRSSGHSQSPYLSESESIDGHASTRNRRPEVPQFYFPAGKDADERERREMSMLRSFLDTLGVSSVRSNASNSSAPATPSSSVIDNTQRPGTSGSAVVGNAVSGSSDLGEGGLSAVGWPDFVQLVVNVAGLPSFMARSIFLRLQEMSGCKGSGSIPRQSVVAYYMQRCLGKRPAQRLMDELLNGAPRNYLIASDFMPVLNALLSTHPGLLFLQQTPEFQHRYAETVIQRIFYTLTSHSHCTRISVLDLERGKFLETLMEVDMEEDINRERRFFSYEHFYVLYCRFWELDSDHDLLISEEDLLRYAEHALTHKIVQRIFEGAGRPRSLRESQKLTYSDFVWFCLSEEDKSSRTAISYWFNCLDLDGDGVLSLYELDYFYAEQVYRMECLGHEPIALRDVVCQVLDMVKGDRATENPVIRKVDLIRSKMSASFFNMMFNLSKLFITESRDPLHIRQEHATPDLTPWDRFAGFEYLRLSSEEEESNAEQQQQQQLQQVPTVDSLVDPLSPSMNSSDVLNGQ